MDVMDDLMQGTEIGKSRLYVQSISGTQHRCRVRLKPPTFEFRLLTGNWMSLMRLIRMEAGLRSFDTRLNSTRAPLSDISSSLDRLQTPQSTIMVEPRMN
jgi:hypothetical protein